MFPREAVREIDKIMPPGFGSGGVIVLFCFADLSGVAVGFGCSTTATNSLLVCESLKHAGVIGTMETEVLGRLNGLIGTSDTWE